MGIERIPFTNFAVDAWRVKGSVKTVFLTHIHSDHLDGIEEACISKRVTRIYCSKITKRLLLKRFSSINSSTVFGLEEDATHIVFTDEPNRTKVPVNVTLIDANHCPGAVMFLFEGYFGRTLYTGDFRLHSLMYKDPFLQKPIDYLYFDNTFCDPRFQFPSQADATDRIIDLIKQNKECNIIIGTDTVGKEELLVSLSIEFNTKIVVDPDKYELIKLMNDQQQQQYEENSYKLFIPLSLFTTDSNQGFIFALLRKNITEKRLIEWNNNRRTLVIIPTGLPVSSNKSNRKYIIHYVPYSSHCSYDELSDFVSFIKPKRLIPIESRSINERKTGNNETIGVIQLMRYLDKSPLLIPNNIPEDIYLSTDDYNQQLSKFDIIQSNLSGIHSNYDYDEDSDSEINQDISDNKDEDDPTFTFNEQWVNQANSLVKQFYPNCGDISPGISKKSFHLWSNKLLNNWSKKQQQQQLKNINKKITVRTNKKQPPNKII